MGILFAFHPDIQHTGLFSNVENNPTFDNTYTRSGYDYSMRYTNDGVWCQIPETQTIYGRIAFRPFIAQNDNLIVEFRDGSAEQVTFRFQGNSGELDIVRDGRSSSDYIDTITDAVTMDEWNYLQFRIKIDNSAGEVDIYMNGELLAELTSEDTQKTSNAWADTIVVYAGRPPAAVTITQT